MLRASFIAALLAPGVAAGADLPLEPIVQGTAELSVSVVEGIDCEVRVDDTLVGFAPLYRSHIPAGVHRLSIDCVAGMSLSRIFRVEPGSHAKMVARGLVISDLGQSADMLAALRVSVPDEVDCDVRVNDMRLGVAPLYDVPLRAGDYEVNVLCMSGRHRRQTLSLQAGVATTLILRAPQRLLLAETRELAFDAQKHQADPPSGPAPLYVPSGPAF